MSILIWYVLAAAGEIAGWFAFWAWLRLHKNLVWPALRINLNSAVGAL